MAVQELRFFSGRLHPCRKYVGLKRDLALEGFASLRPHWVIRSGTICLPQFDFTPSRLFFFFLPSVMDSPTCLRPPRRRMSSRHQHR